MYGGPKLPFDILSFLSNFLLFFLFNIVSLLNLNLKNRFKFFILFYFYLIWLIKFLLVHFILFQFNFNLIFVLFCFHFLKKYYFKFWINFFLSLGAQNCHSIPQYLVRFTKSKMGGKIEIAGSQPLNPLLQPYLRHWSMHGIF